MSQTPLNIQRAAVIGAGAMGRGIVMCLANAGVAVQWVDNNPQMLEQALVTVADTYAHNVRQGRIDQTEADARVARVTAADGYAAIRDVNLVIEAVYENLELKQKIFRELDGLLKPEAILASNTSALDIDAIAAVTRRPQQVLGLHFFSPAHIMKLLEIVRGAQTAPAVLEAALALGKRMGKVSVVSGNCDGFIGNRMLNTYVLEARKMLLEGAYPYQVDAALQGFGFAMGPFRMFDVVGVDLQWRARQLSGIGQDAPEVQVDNRLCELGRFGQKSGNGYYHYEPGSRQAEHDAAGGCAGAGSQRRAGVPSPRDRPGGDSRALLAGTGQRRREDPSGRHRRVGSRHRSGLPQRLRFPGGQGRADGLGGSARAGGHSSALDGTWRPARAITGARRG